MQQYMKTSSTVEGVTGVTITHCVKPPQVACGSVQGLSSQVDAQSLNADLKGIEWLKPQHWWILSDATHCIRHFASLHFMVESEQCFQLSSIHLMLLLVISLRFRVQDCLAALGCEAQVTYVVDVVCLVKHDDTLLLQLTAHLSSNEVKGKHSKDVTQSHCK